MIAFGLSILLFAFWGGVGYAITATLRQNSDRLQNLLLAPAVGLAATVLPVFWLNRLGLPVIAFGKLVALLLLLSSVALLWKFRPKIPGQAYLPFLGIFLLAAFFTGRPLLEFGFDWVSYANDDMANYCLGADRFLHHGFFEIPNLDQLVQGRDYSLFYWFLYTPSGARPGSELLLAWVASLTGLTVHQIFMPTILAFHLILISVTGAFVYQSQRLYSAVFTCVLLSLSALNSLGTLYQLIAQVSGLSLLIGCMTVLLYPFKKMPLSSTLRTGSLTALLVAGLFIVYPEVLPFLVLSFLLYASIRLIQKQLEIQPLLWIMGIAGLMVPLVLNTYLLRVFIFLLRQTSGGIEDETPTEFSFPYYLVPSGLASLWGMQSFSSPSSEPWLSITIAISLLLLIGLMGFAAWLTWNREPIATVTVVMLALGVFLFIHRSDFGLFKLAMFIQPFLLGTVAIVCTQWMQKPLALQLVPLFLISLLNVQTQAQYIQVNQGGNSFSEIPNISQLRVNRQFKETIERLSLSPSQNLVLNTSNIVLAKFQSLYTKNISTIFPTQGLFFFKFFPTGSTNFAKRVFPGTQTTQTAAELTEKINQNSQEATFELVGAPESSPTLKNKFTIPNFTQIKDGLDNSILISPGFRQSILNGRHVAASQDKSFVVQPWKQTQNQLMLINSDLGYEYYLGNILQVDPHNIAIQQLEQDRYQLKPTMAGFGQHLLFETINPSQQARLSLEVTTSLNADGENQLPPAAVMGEKRQAIGLMGRGSAHVFSPPLKPQMIGGFAYLAIDMGVSGQSFPNRRMGLMNLYGKDIQLDRRKIVGFGRDISLVSQEEYANLKPPQSLSLFPKDLSHSDLEYSGLYEDGWISEAAFLKLTQPSSTPPLVVRGIVPMIKDSSFTSELQILVDGQSVTRQVLKPGEFNLQVDIPPSAAPQGQTNPRRIDLRFSKFQHLPKGDDRPVAAQLKFIGFTE